MPLPSNATLLARHAHTYQFLSHGESFVFLVFAFYWVDVIVITDDVPLVKNLSRAYRLCVTSNWPFAR